MTGRRIFIGPHHPHHEASTRVWVLAVMNLVGAAMCAVPGWIDPLSHAHHNLYRISAVCAAAVGLLLLRLGLRINERTQQILLAAYSLQIAVLALYAVRDVSVVALGPAVIVVAAYAGYFCGTRSMYLQVAFALTTYVVGAGLNPAVNIPVGAVLTAIMTAGTLAIVLHTLTQELRRRSYTDPLTGVASRAAWTQTAERTLSGAAAQRSHVAIIDLDYFKSVNDRAGHLAGDQLLRDITRAWQARLPPTALLGRFGGDEFVVLFPHMPDDDVRAAITEMALAHPAPWSIGLARQQPADTTGDLLARADTHLLEAKRNRPRPGTTPRPTTADSQGADAPRP